MPSHAANEWAGAHLKALRVQATLTQQELADLAGMDRSRLSNLETGHYTPGIAGYAAALAPHLGVTPTDLLPPELGPEPLAQTPLDLLREALAGVEAQAHGLRALTQRVEVLERAARSARRRSGGS